MKKFILAALFVISSAGSLFAQNSNIPNGGGGGGGGGGGSVTQGTTPWLIDCSGVSNTLCGLIGGAIPNGTNIIGKVGIDQTTDGTSNLVASKQSGVWIVQPGNTPNTTPWLVQTPAADPCSTIAATYTPISITTAATTRIVAPTSTKKTYICYIFLTSAAADNVGIVEGTGGTCGTGTAGVIGGTIAANGPNFAANGGVSLGNGVAAVAATAGTNVDLCLITSAATPLAGTVKWVQAP